jgi:DNA-binding LytR/AlgR family response regulator
LSAPETDPAADLTVATVPAAKADAARAAIRVEKDGRARDLAVEDIYAIRANAHYSYVHDGEHEYFCTQSISALEAMLDCEQFFRVHRSYVVRLSRVTRVKRAGESAVAELGAPVRCNIPVSRGQCRELKERLGALSSFAGAAAREMHQPS